METKNETAKLTDRQQSKRNEIQKGLACFIRAITKNTDGELPDGCLEKAMDALTDTLAEYGLRCHYPNVLLKVDGTPYVSEWSEAPMNRHPEPKETRKPRHETCRHSFPNIRDGKPERKCLHSATGKDDGKPANEAACSNCPNYDSRYITYPLTITGIEQMLPDERKKETKPCRIRPCDPGCEGRTYFGIHLGDFPFTIGVSHNRRSGRLSVNPVGNPAIYVPELNRVVFGMESWWSAFDSWTEAMEWLETEKPITDEDINGQWYVRLARAMSENETRDGKETHDGYVEKGKD